VFVNLLGGYAGASNNTKTIISASSRNKARKTYFNVPRRNPGQNQNITTENWSRSRLLGRTISINNTLRPVMQWSFSPETYWTLYLFG